MPQKIFLIILLFIGFFYFNNNVFAATRAEMIDEIRRNEEAASKTYQDCQGKSCESEAHEARVKALDNYDNARDGKIPLEEGYKNALGNTDSSGDSNSSGGNTSGGGYIEKASDGTINAYDKDGNLKETSKPGDSGYSIAEEAYLAGGNNKNSGKEETNNTNDKDGTTKGTALSNQAENNTKITSDDYEKGIDAAQKVYDEAKKTYEIKALDGFADISKEKEAMDNAKKGLDNYKDAYANQLKKEAQAKEAARDAECEASQTCFDKPNFVIDTNTFSIGGTGLKQYDSKSTINNTLGTIIQKMMIALGVIALFVMTVGAGYMIMYRGHDEYLSKGKNIFIGGVTALIVALSSYYIVNIIGYVLYK